MVDLRTIFCKSHPTCDSRVFRISSYFNQLKIKVILEHGWNFSFTKHFVEFLGGGGSRDNSSLSWNAISVHKLDFASPFRLLELLLRVQVTSTWTLLGTEHNFKKINTLTFGNNTFLLAQIFEILKIWQNLLIAFQTLKVFMSSALTFKFMTTELLVIPWAFPVIQKNLPFNVNLWQVIGLKIQSFCKMKPREAAFVGKNF